MRILVIGGTGFIGPHVVSCLLGRGHEVSLFHRGVSEAPISEEVEHIHGERADLLGFRARFERFRPEVVLDMFPYSEEDARMTVSVSRTMARRIVALSSMDVYRAYGRIRGSEPGPPDSVPLDEDAPLREKLYPYRGLVEGMDDYDKIPVERTIMGEGELPGTVLRLPMVYGPGDEQHRFFEYLKRMDDHRPAILLEEGFARLRASRGYVEDVAEAIALSVSDERAAGRVYNVGEREAVDEAEWVRILGEAAGWDGDVVELPTEDLPDHLDPGMRTDQNWIVDTTRIRRELGYREAVPTNEAVRRTVAWERANPPKEMDPEQFDYLAEDTVLEKIGYDAERGLKRGSYQST